MQSSGLKRNMEERDQTRCGLSSATEKVQHFQEAGKQNATELSESVSIVEADHPGE